jgi:hypothetical protein
MHPLQNDPTKPGICRYGQSADFPSELASLGWRCQTGFRLLKNGFL